MQRNHPNDQNSTSSKHLKQLESVSTAAQMLIGWIEEHLTIERCSQPSLAQKTEKDSLKD